MKTYTVQEFQKNFNAMINRVEQGEQIKIVNEEGNVAMMIPVDDEIVRIHTEHNDAP